MNALLHKRYRRLVSKKLVLEKQGMDPDDIEYHPAVATLKRRLHKAARKVRQMGKDYQTDLRELCIARAKELPPL